MDDVVYPLDGTVILDFKLDGLGNSAEEQAQVLTAAGYHEITQ